MAAGFERTLRVGSRGRDVEAAKRAVFRFLGEGQLHGLVVRPRAVRRTYGPFFAKHVKEAQRKLGIEVDGVFGPKTAAALDPYLDAYARSLLAKTTPQLIEPKQGFASLDKRLWGAYSLGRSLGLTDLGTYNGASRLPGGGKSDHAYWPARAFDLGIEPDTGQRNAMGRVFFLDMMGRPEVEYVILGDRIWSRDRGLHAYTAGGHDNHVHVSLRHGWLRV